MLRTWLFHAIGSFVKVCLIWEVYLQFNLLFLSIISHTIDIQTTYARNVINLNKLKVCSGITTYLNFYVGRFRAAIYGCDLCTLDRRRKTSVLRAQRSLCVFICFNIYSLLSEILAKI